MLKENNEKSKKKKSPKRFLIKIALICVVAIFCVKSYQGYAKIEKLSVVAPIEFELKVSGQEKILGESEVKKQEALASSENFNVSQISINGGVGISDSMVDFENSGLLTVSNVRSELYSIKDGEKDEVKAIIGFQTNKKTITEVEYLKSGEKNAKIMKDDYFSLSHVVIIPALEPDSVYRYVVKAQDPIGNRVSSDQFVFYTGAPNISLMDVLSNATQKVFGWAMNK